MIVEQETVDLEQVIESSSFAEKFEELLRKYKKKEGKFRFSKKEQQVVEFLHLQIHPSQLAQFKQACALKGVVLPVAAALIGFLLSSSYIQILLSLLAGIVAYIIYLYFVFNILEIIYELEKLYSYREAINFVEYLVMQLRLNPNLENALEFAVKYVKGCFGRDIRIKLKEISFNPLLTPEDLLDYVNKKWGDVIPGLKSAINLVKASIIEKDGARRQELLDAAIAEISDAIYLDIAKRIKGLKQPSMALFYMGVFLPVLLSILYPILIFTPAAVLASRPVAISLFWFLLPSLLALFVVFLLLQRPIIYFVRTRSKCSLPLSQLLAYFSLTLLLLFIIYYFVKVPVAVILPLLLFGFFASTALRRASDKAYKEVLEIKQIEEEFPDTLYLLATKLNQGRPIEEAIEYVIEMLPNYKIVQKFYKQVYELYLRTGATLEQLLFSPEYNLSALLGSELVYNALKTIVDAVKLGPRTSASVVSALITQLSKVKKTKELVDDLFSEIASAMKFLSVFVAPFTLGIVSGLYNVSLSVVSGISRSFSAGGLGAGVVQSMVGISFSAASLSRVPSAMFMALVLGVYTLIITVFLTVYSEYVKEGPILPEILHVLSKNLILAVGVYSVGLIVGSFCLGGL
ncbi:MAG: hypothetical protein GXO42_02745 [bacterium]|nr:hypothetical protein [bacterium]